MHVETIGRENRGPPPAVNSRLCEPKSHWVTEKKTWLLRGIVFFCFSMKHSLRAVALTVNLGWEIISTRRWMKDLSKQLSSVLSWRTEGRNKTSWKLFCIRGITRIPIYQTHDPWPMLTEWWLYFCVIEQWEWHHWCRRLFEAQHQK